MMRVDRRWTVEGSQCGVQTPPRGSSSSSGEGPLLLRSRTVPFRLPRGGSTTRRSFVAAELFVLLVLAGNLSVGHGFGLQPPSLHWTKPTNQNPKPGRHTSSCTSTARGLLPFRDADLVEQLVGGVRYSLVPLPPDMHSTTLFVGGIEEFATDDDLSRLMGGNPACVVRKPNLTSLRYGFVAFRTVAEAEAALLRTCGLEWRGCELDVQPIRRDLEVVRVPEKLVAYVKGPKAVRRLLLDDQKKNNNNNRSPTSSSSSSAKPKPNKRAAKVPPSPPLKSDDKAEYDRALVRGYLTVVSESRDHRRQSVLVQEHRRWCDKRRQPQVVLVKGRGPTAQWPDRILIDLSPLRLHRILGNRNNRNDEDIDDDDGIDADSNNDDTFLLRWKADALGAAYKAGVRLRDDYSDRETCEADARLDDDDDDRINVEEEEEDDDDGINDPPDGDWTCAYTVTIDEASLQRWANCPIDRIPPLSLGIFEGERAQAKAMAKELSELWDLPDPAVAEQRALEKQERKARAGRKAPRRNRGGGHHQAFW